MSLGRAVYPGPVAVVGDIHGRLQLLVELLDRLAGLPVLVVGDVCDHGEDSKGVIELLVRRGATGVRGNHEDWLLAWAGGAGFDSFALRPFMGGRTTLDSYGVVGRAAREIEAERWRVPAAHVAWLRGLAEAIDLQVGEERYWLVHAGVPLPPPELNLRPEEVVPWFASNRPIALRDSPAGPVALVRPLIVGHRPLLRPRRDATGYFLDTGAGVLPEGALTALILPEGRFVTVPERRESGR